MQARGSNEFNQFEYYEKVIAEISNESSKAENGFLNEILALNQELSIITEENANKNCLS